MRYDNLHEPDVLISELGARARRDATALSSEKRLMLAVLQNAVDCCQKYATATDAAGRELFAEATAWFECRTNTGLFSFESISEALNIQPDYLRRGLNEWLRANRAARQDAPRQDAPRQDASRQDASRQASTT